MRYILKRYGTPFTVFGVYLGGPSTKDVVHRKRSVTYVGETVHVSGSIVLRGKQEDNI